MNKRLADTEYRAASLQREIFENVAAGYTGKGDVLHFQPDCPPAQLRELADRIGEHCGGIAFVYTGEEMQKNICIMSKTDDLKELGKALKERFQARGGGKPGYFQGTLQATHQELEAFFEERD
jgi:alanyl-tRNA synthetase